MKKFVADTNIFLRFLLNDIPSQANESERYFKQAMEKEIEILVFSITIFEVIFSLGKYYGKTKKEIIELTKTIVSAPFLKVEDKEVFLEALKRYRNFNMSFVDIFIYCKTEIVNGNILSFDKHFKSLTQEK